MPRLAWVSEYMHKLSLQREKKRERKAKASSTSSSFLGFLPSMPVPPCQLLLSAGAGGVTTIPSSSVYSVTFLATAPVVSAAPFVPSVDVTPMVPGCKWCRVVSEEESKDTHRVWGAVGFWPAVFFLFAVLLLAWVPIGSASGCLWFPVPFSVMSPVWCPVLFPGPIVYLLGFFYPFGVDPVAGEFTPLWCNGCRTTRCCAQGLGHLLLWVSRVVHWRLVRHWTLSRHHTRLGLSTAGILLRLLRPSLVPVPIPVLQCWRAVVPRPGVAPAHFGLLLLVRVPRGRGSPGSRLVSRVIHSLVQRAVRFVVFMLLWRMMTSLLFRIICRLVVHRETFSRVLMTIFCHHLWACVQRRCWSFFHIWEFAAVTSIGLRGRKWLRPVP